MNNLSLLCVLFISTVLVGCSGDSSSGSNSETSNDVPDTSKQYSGLYKGRARLTIYYELSGSNTASVPMEINVNSDDSTYTVTLHSGDIDLENHQAKGTLTDNRFNTSARSANNDCGSATYSITYKGRIENNRAIGTLFGLTCPVDYAVDISGDFNLTR